MLVKSYIWGISLAAALAFLAWLMVLWYFDPLTSGIAGQILFFLTLTPTLLGIFVLGLYAIRRRLNIEPLVALTISGRQGSALGLIGVILLIFKVADFLAWWNVGLLILLGVVVEAYARIRIDRGANLQ